MISEVTISIQSIKSTKFSLKKKSIKDLNTKRKIVIKKIEKAHAPVVIIICLASTGSRRNPWISQECAISFYQVRKKIVNTQFRPREAAWEKERSSNGWSERSERSEREWGERERMSERRKWEKVERSYRSRSGSGCNNGGEHFVIKPSTGIVFMLAHCFSVALFHGHRFLFWWSTKIFGLTHSDKFVDVCRKKWILFLFLVRVNLW